MPAPVPAPSPAPVPVDLVEIAAEFDRWFDGDPSDRGCDAVLAALRDGSDRGPVIEVLATGPGAELLGSAPIPPGCRALALGIGGWQAPLAPHGAPELRPSAHPQRRRVFSTCVVGGPDARIVTVLRIAGEPTPRVVTDPGVGRVPDALRACWARRPDAP